MGSLLSYAQGQNPDKSVINQLKTSTIIMI
jgi:hypothetical protein